jgi:hypothetical protein
MSTVLTWRDSSCAGRIEATSGRQVPAAFTGARYLVDADCGFRPGARMRTPPGT